MSQSPYKDLPPSCDASALFCGPDEEDLQMRPAVARQSFPELFTFTMLLAPPPTLPPLANIHTHTTCSTVQLVLAPCLVRPVKEDTVRKGVPSRRVIDRAELLHQHNRWLLERHSAKFSHRRQCVGPGFRIAGDGCNGLGTPSWIACSEYNGIPSA